MLYLNFDYSKIIDIITRNQIFDYAIAAPRSLVVPSREAWPPPPPPPRTRHGRRHRHGPMQAFASAAAMGGGGGQSSSRRDMRGQQLEQRHADPTSVAGGGAEEGRV